MKLPTIKRIVVTYLVNHIYVGTRCYETKRKLLNSIGYEIGEGTRVAGPVFCTGHLKVGKDCWIGRGITVHGNGSVVIGDNCDIAPEVVFLTGGHKIGDASRRAGEGENYHIEVGSGTWLGARATIGRSVTIGRSCMIGACACVMQDVENNKLVGGVPAREIRTLDD